VPIGGAARCIFGATQTSMRGYRDLRSTQACYPVDDMFCQRKQASAVPRDPFSRSPAALLEDEFALEKASALGRLGRALEAALHALAEFDAAHPRSGAAASSATDRHVRAALVADAGLALWQLIVQREACGLRDIRHVMRDYRVPPDVAARMGVMPDKNDRLRR
jgi:hypothetical protein